MVWTFPGGFHEWFDVKDNTNLQRRLESAISTALGEPIVVSNVEAVQGGSINHCQRLILSDGSCFFVKTQPGNSSTDTFRIEFQSLLALGKPGVIQVPRPIACDDDFLIMEFVVPGRPSADWQAQMGHSLARLHMATRQTRFGFEGATYLGTTRQDNRWQDSWLDFWRDQRLGAQLQLFSCQAGQNDPLVRAGFELMENLDHSIGDIREPAVLLHGDLWAGNAFANERGAPVIVDPACYYGHREAEIGMMRLFGGFGAVCEAAYNEVWPFESGHDRRIDLYRLYHQLNHLNLFGHSYYHGALSTVRSLL